jgi:hypothetical protein
VYLARSLWPLISRYADGSVCLKCERPADYVQAVLVPDARGRKPVNGYFRLASAYCRTHVQAVSRRRGIPCVDTEEALFAVVAARKQAQQAHYDELRAQNAAREAATMAEFGRVLQLSGYKGRLYRLPDGSPECQMNDGTTVRPCCWREGARLIDNRVGGRTAEPGHNEECLQRSRTGSETR